MLSKILSIVTAFITTISPFGNNTDFTHKKGYVETINIPSQNEFNQYLCTVRIVSISNKNKPYNKPYIGIYIIFDESISMESLENYYNTIVEAAAKQNINHNALEVLVSNYGSKLITFDLNKTTKNKDIQTLTRIVIDAAISMKINISKVEVIY